MGRRSPVPSKECVVCKRTFHIKPSQKPYLFKKQVACSRTCNARLQSSKQVGKKAHNNIQEPNECRLCMAITMRPPSLRRPFCNRKCMAKWMSINNRAENHWHWMGGITEKKSRDLLYEGYKEWRRAVYQRDGFKCRVCGSAESNTLRAHHIKPREDFPELLLELTNGLTVCNNCHKEIHYGKLKDDTRFLQRKDRRTPATPERQVGLH